LFGALLICFNLNEFSSGQPLGAGWTAYNKLKNEFMEKYSRDFNITGGGFMKTF